MRKHSRGNYTTANYRVFIYTKMYYIYKKKNAFYLTSSVTNRQRRFENLKIKISCLKVIKNIKLLFLLYKGPIPRRNRIYLLKYTLLT